MTQKENPWVKTSWQSSGYVVTWQFLQWLMAPVCANWSMLGENPGDMKLYSFVRPLHKQSFIHITGWQNGNQETRDCMTYKICSSPGCSIPMWGRVKCLFLDGLIQLVTYIATIMMPCLYKSKQDWYTIKSQVCGSLIKGGKMVLWVEPCMGGMSLNQIYQLVIKYLNKVVYIYINSVKFIFVE